MRRNIITVALIQLETREKPFTYFIFNGQFQANNAILFGPTIQKGEEFSSNSFSLICPTYTDNNICRVFNTVQFPSFCPYISYYFSAVIFCNQQEVPA